MIAQNKNCTPFPLSFLSFLLTSGLSYVSNKKKIKKIKKKKTPASTECRLVSIHAAMRII